MNIKLDENIPFSLVSELPNLGHDVKTVHEQDMQGVTDSQLWDSIQQEKRFLITQDLDFSDITVYKPGTHAGILLVRLREPGRQSLRQKIYQLFSAKHAEDDWRGAFIVLTDHKSRVHRP